MQNQPSSILIPYLNTMAYTIQLSVALIVLQDIVVRGLTVFKDIEAKIEVGFRKGLTVELAVEELFVDCRLTDSLELAASHSIDKQTHNPKHNIISACTLILNWFFFLAVLPQDHTLPMLHYWLRHHPLQK